MTDRAKQKFIKETIKQINNYNKIYLTWCAVFDKGKKMNRYILFKIGDDQQATLIYMEGDLKSEELINKLFVRE